MRKLDVKEDYRHEFFNQVSDLIDAVSVFSDYPLDGSVTAKKKLKQTMRRAVRRMYQLAYGGTDPYAEGLIEEVTDTTPEDKS